MKKVAKKAPSKKIVEKSTKEKYASKKSMAKHEKKETKKEKMMEGEMGMYKCGGKHSTKKYACGGKKYAKGGVKTSTACKKCGMKKCKC